MKTVEFICMMLVLEPEKATVNDGMNLMEIVIQQEGEVCHPIVVLAEKVIFISGCKRVFASMIFEAPSNGGC
ncbi:hypothetical protein Hanom_Chr14g01254861 [Helianthus anomalus]